MTVNSPQVPPLPPAPQAPKKTNVWMWVGIGCGVVLLLGLGTCFAGGMFLKNKISGFAADMEKNPAKTAAELAVRMNPDVELVSSDDTSMTVRDKKTGKEVTVNFEDAAEGKFSFSTDEGEASVDVGQDGRMTVTGPDGQTANWGTGGSVPDWLPAYPGGEISGTFDANTAEGRSGAYTVTSADSLASVMAFYEEELRGAGFEVQKMTYEGESSGGTVTGTSGDEKRTVGVSLSVADGRTQALVTFSEKP